MDVGFECVTLPSAEMLDGGLTCSLVGCCGGRTNADAVGVVVVRIMPQVVE